MRRSELTEAAEFLHSLNPFYRYRYTLKKRVKFREQSASNSGGGDGNRQSGRLGQTSEDSLVLLVCFRNETGNDSFCTEFHIMFSVDLTH